MAVGEFCPLTHSERKAPAHPVTIGPGEGVIFFSFTKFLIL